MRFHLRLGFVPALLLVAGLASGCAASEAKRAAAEGARLYERGEYEAARPLLERAAEKGMSDGELFYQLAYIYDRTPAPDKARAYREKAIPLLEKRSREADASLQTYYYLTAAYANLGRDADVKRTAEAGVGRFGARTDLSGADFFRLGRLRHFAGRDDQAETAYRSSVESFSRETDPNPVLFALALSADAEADFRARRYGESARKYARATELSPKNPPSAFRMALAQMGAGDLPGAAQSFDRVRDEELSSEAQYGADVARRLQAAGGAVDKSSTGAPLPQIDNAALEEALRTTGESLRAARQSIQTGGGPPEKARETERLFFSLAAEWMLRGNPLRETSLSGNYADLIRR
jgi:tetratricopeptide (TPR) repeat protein